MHWLRDKDSKSIGISGWSGVLMLFHLDAHGTLLIGLRDSAKQRTKFLTCTMCSEIRVPQRFTISDGFAIRSIEQDVQDVRIVDDLAKLDIVASAASIEGGERIRAWYEGDSRTQNLVSRFEKGDY